MLLNFPSHGMLKSNCKVTKFLPSPQHFSKYNFTKIYINSYELFHTKFCIFAIDYELTRKSRHIFNNEALC